MTHGRRHGEGARARAGQDAALPAVHARTGGRARSGRAAPTPSMRSTGTRATVGCSRSTARRPVGAAGLEGRSPGGRRPRRPAGGRGGAVRRSGAGGRDGHAPAHARRCSTQAWSTALAPGVDAVLGPRRRRRLLDHRRARAAAGLFDERRRCRPPRRATISSERDSHLGPPRRGARRDCATSTRSRMRVRSQPASRASRFARAARDDDAPRLRMTRRPTATCAALCTPTAACSTFPSHRWFGAASERRDTARSTKPSGLRSTSGAARVATSSRSPNAGCSRSASTSPPPSSTWRSPSRRQRARTVRVRPRSRHRAVGAPRCCSTATSASAATRSRCSRRVVELLRDDGRIIVEIEPDDVVDTR